VTLWNQKLKSLAIYFHIGNIRSEHFNKNTYRKEPNRMSTQTVTLDGIKTALQGGHRVRAFLSGGGLRVIRIEKEGKLKGYGEHPHVDEALIYADEDFKKRGRPYKEVYGVDKDHYLTGSREKSNELDGWILQGRKFEAWQENEIVYFKLGGMAETRTSQEIIDQVLSTGQDIRWENRGYTYRSYRSLFGNGQKSVSTEVIGKPEGVRGGADPWMYDISKTGQGSDFWEACQNAFQAPEVEVSER
jgi:hypothetical protein